LKQYQHDEYHEQKRTLWNKLVWLKARKAEEARLEQEHIAQEALRSSSQCGRSQIRILATQTKTASRKSSFG
jgi:hypothetical protein